MSRPFRRHLEDLAFILPAALLFCGFVLMPFIQGVPYSMYTWDGFSPTRTFVGFSNYLRAFRDPAIANAVGNSVQYTVLHTLFSNLFGLAIALLVRRRGRLNNLIRTVSFLPFVLSLVLTAILWTYLFSNVLYRYLSIPTPLGNTNTVMMGLAMIAVWRDAGYCMVVYIAGLQGVPPSYYEAATIEGAGPVRQFFSITMPLIVPAFTANLTLLLSWGLKMFDYSIVATGGGPGRASETIAMVVYRNVFEYYRAGYGQALAVLLTVAIFLVSSSTARFLRRQEVEL